MAEDAYPSSSTSAAPVKYSHKYHTPSSSFPPPPPPPKAGTAAKPASYSEHYHHQQGAAAYRDYADQQYHGNNSGGASGSTSRDGPSPYPDQYGPPGGAGSGGRNGGVGGHHPAAPPPPSFPSAMSYLYAHDDFVDMRQSKEPSQWPPMASRFNQMGGPGFPAGMSPGAGGMPNYMYQRGPHHGQPRDKTAYFSPPKVSGNARNDYKMSELLIVRIYCRNQFVNFCDYLLINK